MEREGYENKEVGPSALLVPAQVSQVSQLSHENQIKKISAESVRLQRAGMQRQSLLNNSLSEDTECFFFS